MRDTDCPSEATSCRVGRSASFLAIICNKPSARESEGIPDVVIVIFLDGLLIVAPSIRLVNTAVGAHMAVLSKVKKLIPAVTLAHHIALGWRKFKLPVALHCLAFRALKLRGSGWRYSYPCVPASDTESLTCSVLLLRGGGLRKGITVI